jgi:release factor glutamine methyltransferase
VAGSMASALASVRRIWASKLGRRRSLPASVVDRLRAAGCVFAEDEARLLVAEARTPGDLDAMVDRRTAGIPLEYVLGWAEFGGLRVDVEPGVFVPRARTEFLARRAVALAHQAAALAPPTPVAVDMCCGSGALGAVLAAAVPGIEVYAADNDPAAVSCARRNLPDGLVFEGDLYGALPNWLARRVDVLVANAPYVPSDELELMPREARLHEPHATLDGGADGLELVRRVIAGARSWLRPGGHLLVETSEDQATAVLREVARTGLTPRLARDEELDATVVIGGR